MLAASEVFAVVTLGPSLDLVLEGAGWALYPVSQADLCVIQLSPTISPFLGVCTGKRITPARRVLTRTTEADQQSLGLSLALSPVDFLVPLPAWLGRSEDTARLLRDKQSCWRCWVCVMLRPMG